MIEKFLKKDLTFEDMLDIIGMYEENRMCYDEKIFNLWRNEDAKEWIDLYGAAYLAECTALGQFWLGGRNLIRHTFTDSDKDKCTLLDKVSAKGMLDLVVLDKIEDMFDEYLKQSKMDTQDAIFIFNTNYNNLIDFGKYYSSKYIPKKYRWVAESDDGAFQSYSDCEFEQKIDCYNNMRSHALEKMKWNTNFDEDFAEGTPIGYRVQFSQDEIVHSSYSGIYLYRIIDADVFNDSNSQFWKKMKEELNSDKYQKLLM